MRTPSPFHVLVVDDEADIKWLFTKRFRKDIQAGRLAFTFAHTGEEALALLAQDTRQHIVLVLSDINMPGMTGLDLLRHIKATYPHLPVHIITAYGDQANKDWALQVGASGFLTKPLDFDVLRATLLG